MEHKSSDKYDNIVVIPFRDILFSNIPCSICRKCHTFKLKRVVFQCDKTFEKLSNRSDLSKSKIENMTMFDFDVYEHPDYFKYASASQYASIIKKLKSFDFVRVHADFNRRDILPYIIDDFNTAFGLDFEIKDGVRSFNDRFVSELKLSKPITKIWGT